MLPTLNITLPYKDLDQFPDMLKNLEENAVRVGIASISMTNASLEEVFLKCVFMFFNTVRFNHIFSTTVAIHKTHYPLCSMTLSMKWTHPAILVSKTETISIRKKTLLFRVVSSWPFSIRSLFFYENIGYFC